MDFLVVPGAKLDGANLVLINAVPESMTVGVASNGKERYSSIDIKYSQKNCSVIEAIFKKMKELKQFPTAHLVDNGTTYDVLVVWDVTYDSLQGLTLVAPQYARTVKSKSADEKYRVISIGEAEFRKGLLKPFVDKYQEDKRFMVCIRNSNNIPVNGMFLTKLESEPPNILPSDNF
jgi:hypothetical protein